MERKRGCCNDSKGEVTRKTLLLRLLEFVYAIKNLRSFKVLSIFFIIHLTKVASRKSIQGRRCRSMNTLPFSFRYFLLLFGSLCPLVCWRGIFFYISMRICDLCPLEMCTSDDFNYYSPFDREFVIVCPYLTRSCEHIKNASGNYEVDGHHPMEHQKKVWLEKNRYE